jgi:hypothetical protein
MSSVSAPDHEGAPDAERSDTPLVRLARARGCPAIFASLWPAARSIGVLEDLL